jgi:hypothetical protein
MVTEEELSVNWQISILEGFVKHLKNYANVLEAQRMKASPPTDRNAGRAGKERQPAKRRQGRWALGCAFVI